MTQTFYHFGLGRVVKTLLGDMLPRGVMAQMDVEQHTNWKNGQYVLLPRGPKLAMAWNPTGVLPVEEEIATVQDPEELAYWMGKAGRNHIVVPVKPHLPQHNGRLVYRVHPVTPQEPRRKIA